MPHPPAAVAMDEAVSAQGDNHFPVKTAASRFRCLERVFNATYRTREQCFRLDAVDDEKVHQLRQFRRRRAHGRRVQDNGRAPAAGFRRDRSIDRLGHLVLQDEDAGAVR